MYYLIEYRLPGAKVNQETHLNLNIIRINKNLKKFSKNIAKSKLLDTDYVIMSLQKNKIPWVETEAALFVGEHLLEAQKADGFC